MTLLQDEVARALAHQADLACAAVVAVLADADGWRPWQDEAWRLLDADESARARRQRDPRSGERLAMAYALRRALLGVCLGRPARDVPLRRALNGRPFIEASDLHISLSHSEAAVAIALSREGVVGIDVEQVHRAGVMHEVAAQVASASEWAVLQGLPDEPRAAALLSLWVRKEALLKAAGVGLSIEMPAFEVLGRSESTVPVGPPLRARVARLDAGADLEAALALASTGPDPASVPLLRLAPSLAHPAS